MINRPSRYAHNMRWDALAQAGIRVTRLLSTAVLARYLSESEFGIVALVIGTNDLLRVFTQNGLVDQLVQSKSDAELQQRLPSAFTLACLISLALCVVSLTLSVVLPKFYGLPQLSLPILLMSFSYLFIPFNLLPTVQVMRSNSLKKISFTLFVTTTWDNVLSALLAFAGLGFWAVVIPRLFVSPLWSFVLSKLSPWRLPGFSFYQIGRMWSFSSKVLYSETLIVLQSNIDYFVLGYFLGKSELGLYYFAFNAGLGFTLSLISSLLPSLYVDLCAAGSDLNEVYKRFSANIRTMMRIFIPAVALQVSFAPLYVPIVFGQDWVDRGALPILQIICLSALARPLARATTYLARTLNCLYIDTIYQTILTASLFFGLISFVRSGLIGVALTILIVHLVIQILYFGFVPRFLMRTMTLDSSS